MEDKYLFTGETVAKLLVPWVVDQKAPNQAWVRTSGLPPPGV